MSFIIVMFFLCLHWSSNIQKKLVINTTFRLPIIHNYFILYIFQFLYDSISIIFIILKIIFLTVFLTTSYLYRAKSLQISSYIIVKSWFISTTPYSTLPILDLHLVPYCLLLLLQYYRSSSFFIRFHNSSIYQYVRNYFFGIRPSNFSLKLARIFIGNFCIRNEEL